MEISLRHFDIITKRPRSYKERIFFNNEPDIDC